MRRSHMGGRAVVLLVAVTTFVACAEHAGPRIQIEPIPYAPEAQASPSQASPAPVPAVTPAPPVAEGSPAGAPAPTPLPSGVTALPVESSDHPHGVLRELCRQEGRGDILDESRRALEETFCGATLWLDSLFGGAPDVANARAVSGRIELTGVHTDFYGMQSQAHVHLNYDLPNLHRRVRLFLGRADDELVSDREEPFAVREQQFGLLGGQDWLAGLGYSPPGPISNHFDFSVGARIKTAPEVFTQARYRQDWFLGERTVWRFREAGFYDNRDHLGSTTSLDYEHVLRPDLLVRWWNVGTVTQRSSGLEWRNSLLLYYNLREGRAMAGELFLRGATGAPVVLREYGTRVIYRQSLGRQYLWGDFILGYTWPREQIAQVRSGSKMIGIGLEMQFGDRPY